MTVTLPIPKTSTTPTNGPDLSRTYTAEELLDFPSDWHYELINGRLREINMPTGEEHGFYTMSLSSEITMYVRAHGLGRCYAAETGFLLARDPDIVKAPDFAFVAQGRLPEGRTRGYLPVVPDLVLETLSPSDRNTTALQKIGAWLDFGVQMVLDLNPQVQTLTVYRPDAPSEVLGPNGTLGEGDVLPGFALPLSRLFDANSGVSDPQ